MAVDISLLQLTMATAGNLRGRMGKDSKYYNSPKELAYRKKYKQRPEVKERHRIATRNYYHTPNGKAAGRRQSLKRLYNISIEQYDMLFNSQHGVCAICSKPQRDNRKLFVDHDHETNKVRGLLCDKCNFILGLSGESPSVLQEGINYLAKHKRMD